MRFDHGRQSLFFIALAALILLHGALTAGAQTAKEAAGHSASYQKQLGYLQYHQEAEKIDEKAHTVDLDKFLALRAKKGTVVLDLRSPAEYAAGHIDGAVQFGADILMPTRMIALTNVSLPQFILQGYKNTYKLGPVWENTGSWDASQKNLARLPMVPKGK